MFVTLLCLAVVLILVLLIGDTKKPKGYPPGPKWLPILGNYLIFRNLQQILNYNHLVWEHFSKCYGPVVGLKLGFIRVVVVSGSEAIQQVLTREEFDGRPDGFLFRFRTFGERLGIVFADGPFWKEQRKFCSRSLRKFGMGKKEMEQQIIHQAQLLVAVLKTQTGQPIAFHEVFNVAVINNLWAMMADKKYELGDEKVKTVLKLVYDLFRLTDTSGGVLNQLPFVRHFAPNLSGFTQHKEALMRIWKFFEESIDSHEENRTKKEPRDFMDVFLDEIGSKKNYTKQQLLSICLDLFFAGSETTTNTLGFAMMYMIKYPDVQKKVQKEIDTVLKGQTPTIDAQASLPYTMAVLMEIQRIVTVAPLGVPHRATTDTNLLGHTIPKGTIIFTNLFGLHVNEKYWPQPNTFNPERFIDSFGNVVNVKNEYFAPFGYGRRRCLGEPLARCNLFLFFTIMLQNFTVKMSPQHQLPQPEYLDGFTLSPAPYYAILQQRN